MLADKLNISPAVIAGRLRRETVGYSALNRIVGQRQVRKLFPDVKWKLIYARALWYRLNDLRQLQVAAKRIRELHLSWALAFRLE